MLKQALCLARLSQCLCQCLHRLCQQQQQQQGSVAEAAAPDLPPQVLALLPLMGLCSQHPNPALKLAAACCFAALAAAHTQTVLPPLLRLLTPLVAGKCPAILVRAHPAGRACRGRGRLPSRRVLLHCWTCYAALAPRSQPSPSCTGTQGMSEEAV